MPRFPVNPNTEAALVQRMERLGIRERDLDEKFIKGSGPGGQKINKTSSCVQLTHLPTEIEIRCQKTRSQALNRYHARRELCERLEQKLFGEKAEKQKAREKIRRQKRKRSKRAKEKLLLEKRHTATKKSLRRKPADE